MNYCDKCDYKVISNKMFEAHKLTHAVEYPEVAPEVTEVKVEPTPEPVPVTPVSDEITIRFIKDIEVTINGIHYAGTEIKVKNMSVASEIVRIAREAYGPTILA